MRNLDDVKIVGVGIHNWGKFPEKAFADLGVVAARNALKDANMDWKDIQAIVAGMYVWGPTGGFNVGQELTARLGETGIPVTNVFNMCATATSVFRSAYHVVASGEKENCLAIGIDVSPKGFFGCMGNPDDQDTDFLRWKMMGLPNPGFWAIECRKRMEKYGTTEQHLAKAKVICSKHGALNPKALYRKVYTEEEVLNSPMVSDPLRLYMICATRDGAAAAILSSAKKAKQYNPKPISIAGVGLGSCMYGDPTIRLGLLSCPSKGSAPLLSESYRASKMAYEMAGIGPEDIDFVEIPDNSSWHYLQYIETLGFCQPGEADHLLDEEAFAIGGKSITVCPSGGASSFGEAVSAQGLLQIFCIVEQLRGQAGAGQVEKAKIGMGQTYGQLGNSASVILKA